MRTAVEVSVATRAEFSCERFDEQKDAPRIAIPESNRRIAARTTVPVASGYSVRMADTGTILEARIERLMANGAGLARVDGRVLFVRGGLPGDRVRARVVRSAKRHDEALVEELLEASPDRRTPRCAHFGACGGCALQDLAYPAQLVAKRELLLDALRSIAGIRPEFEIVVLGSPEYGWRSRAEFQVLGDEGAARPAAIRARSKDLEPVHECPVLLPTLEAELKSLADGSRAIPTGSRHLHLAAGDAAVAVVPTNAKGQVIGKEREVVQKVLGLELAFGASGFFQANRVLLESLVERATGGARGDVAFDLYAGSGLFSVQLARAFDIVMAVEEDAAAVERLRANAKRNGRTGVLAEASDVGRWLVRAKKLGPDFVLMDPPRSGTEPGVVDAVAAIGPREISIVSCDPAMLARDLKTLVASGYVLESLVVIDLFPQTLHVETVARLTRIVE